NFVETMLSLAGKGESIKVVDDQIGSPTYAPDLAQATLALVESKKPHGIYHRTNSGSTSWHGFAKEIFTVFNREVDLEPCTTAEFPRPAKRPAFSVLRSTKLEPMRSWQEALHEYVAHSHG
ncbi:MAG: sugar nucleotide-binding protein, partial [bacterium]|nr:sugar nucleotide-binding protein [bacterium]